MIKVKKGQKEYVWLCEETGLFHISIYSFGDYVMSLDDAYEFAKLADSVAKPPMLMYANYSFLGEL